MSETEFKELRGLITTLAEQQAILAERQEIQFAGLKADLANLTSKVDEHVRVFGRFVDYAQGQFVGIHERLEHLGGC